MGIETLKWPKVGTLLAGVALSALCGFVTPTASEAQAPAQKPNILFVMTDDVGWMTPGSTTRA